MTSKIVYTGDLHTMATHIKSDSVIETDAPVDNMGKGERFSPTDLVATGLGTCMVTTMGIAARDKGISLDGTEVTVEKIMGSAPRRIVEIKITIRFPDHRTDAKDQAYLERVALNCPVAKSLHPDLLQTVQFIW